MSWCQMEPTHLHRQTQVSPANLHTTHMHNFNPHEVDKLVHVNSRSHVGTSARFEIGLNEIS